MVPALVNFYSTGKADIEADVLNTVCVYVCVCVCVCREREREREREVLHEHRSVGHS
jgi:hypothetical protein